MLATESSYRILVVDDDAALRDVVGRYLRRSGYTVATAHDAESALELASTEELPFDAIITDVHMPHMDGIELMTQLHAHRPTQCVVVVTGHVDETLAHSALAGGAANYLFKPFKLGDLEAVVRKAIIKSLATTSGATQ